MAIFIQITKNNVYTYVDNISENVIFNILDVKVIKNEKSYQYIVHGYIQTLQNEFLKENIKEMETNLKQLNGIEQMIYYEVVVNGLSVTKAIDRVSYKVDKDSSTLWKNYYPKVKQKIMALKKMQ